MMINYIDPGTGSMALQVIIAGIVGFLMFFKHVKFRIIKFFKKKDTTNVKE